MTGILLGLNQSKEACPVHCQSRPQVPHREWAIECVAAGTPGEGTRPIQELMPTPCLAVLVLRLAAEGMGSECVSLELGCLMPGLIYVRQDTQQNPRTAVRKRACLCSPVA